MGIGKREQYLDFFLHLHSPGRPLDPYTLLNKAVCNVIASLIYARRFDYGDPDFIKVLKILKESMGEQTGLFPEVGEQGRPSVLSIFPEEAVGRGFGKETSRSANHRIRILELGKPAAMREGCREDVNQGQGS